MEYLHSKVAKVSYGSCPMGHSQPFVVGNEKCSTGGRNHFAKPIGDVLREDFEIMPWAEVSQVVLQPVPDALLFYPYSYVHKLLPLVFTKW